MKRRTFMSLLGSAAATWPIVGRTQQRLPTAGFQQQGNKLVGTGFNGSPQQGTSVAISGNGDTMIVGGNYDNKKAGAAWVFTRSI
jgi:hypothetical protein